jgi:vacuolar-type H+-ATPase subunit I/STV1
MCFIKSNLITILKITGAVFLIYWIMFVLTPSVKMSAESKAKIDSLNANIMKYEEENKKIDTAIAAYNTEIHKIDNIISNIKQEKTIIKEFYHETIISIDTFSRSQIDSFFTKRYGGFNP